MSPKIFFIIFLENVAFIEKTIRQKNIQNLISQKKSYIQFWRKMILCPKNCQKIFFTIFSENVAFFKKLLDRKNIQNLIFLKEGYIHFRH